MTGSSLDILKTGWLPLRASHQGNDETGRGYYVKLSLEYTLILMLASITVFSNCLYFPKPVLLEFV